MTKSNDAYQNNMNELWNFIRENPKLVGIGIVGNKGFDLLSALADIREQLPDNPTSAAGMIDSVASLLVASATGHGQEFIEEILVQEAMFHFDDSIKEVLDEEPK